MKKLPPFGAPAFSFPKRASPLTHYKGIEPVQESNPSDDAPLSSRVKERIMMMARLAALGPLLALALRPAAAYVPSGTDPGLVIKTNETCDSPPPVLSYHVHAVVS